MITKLDKNSLKCLSVIILIAIFVCVGFFYYLKKTEIEEPEEKKPEEESLIEQQLRELDLLREGTKAFSKKEIQEQLEELNKLR